MWEGVIRRRNNSQDWQEFEGNVLLGKRTYVLVWKSTLVDIFNVRDESLPPALLNWQGQGDLSEVLALGTKR
jgi:hypothetical protein